jgi:hypothetical protein
VTVGKLEAEIAPFDQQALEFLSVQPDGRLSLAGLCGVRDGQPGGGRA